MSARAAQLVRTFKVGPFECTLTFPAVGNSQVLAMAAEWAPKMPEHLTVAELEQYRAGRNSAIAELAAQTGVNVAVIE